MHNQENYQPNRKWAKNMNRNFTEQNLKWPVNVLKISHLSSN